MEKIVIKVERNNNFIDEKLKKGHKKLTLYTNNVRAGQVNEFKISDIKLINPSEKSLDNLPAFEKEIIRKGYVPLDIYQANALFKIIKEDYETACGLDPDLPFTNIVFFGSSLKKEEGNSEINYYTFFKYDYFNTDRIPEFVCSHENPGTLNSECVAAVFKKSFWSEAGPAENTNSESQDYTVADAFFRFTKDDTNPKKEPAEMPTLEQCQAKTIKLLQERLKQVTKERDELKAKYEKASLITKPQLSEETIELLCKRVCDFKLSTRVINATDTDNVIYLFQLVSMRKAQLGRMRNIYKKSIKEISDFIEGLGLSLGTELSQEEHNYFWEIIERKIAAK